MSIAEKASLAQRYLAIVHNHFIVMMSIGIILILIAIISVLIYFYSDNMKICWCWGILGAFLTGVAICLTTATLDAPNTGATPANAVGSIAKDYVIVHYYRELPHVSREDKQSYHQLQEPQGRRTYEISHRYAVNHRKLNRIKYYLKHYHAKAPWIDMKFNSPIQVHISVKR